MTRVLLVGFDPEAVDYSDPALPPGLNAETIAAGVEIAMKAIRERGWDADHAFIRPDDTREAIEATVRKHMEAACDCVVIGAGVRLQPKYFQVFETVLNAIHRHAPQAAIAFNTLPEDSADAAARWL